MKNIAAVLFLLFQTIFAGAQGNRSTLNIRLSDGAPLLVTINSRDFKKVNTLITIADLPRKRHNIQVYKFRAYVDGKGGKAELMYSGDFKIKPGFTYDCVVDVTTRKLYIKNINESPGTYTPPPPAARPDFRKDVPLAENEVNMSPQSDLSRLQKQIEAVKEDTKKLSLAKDYIAQHPVYTADVRTISSWIMFDDNKMDFLKEAYPHLKDRENYSSLSDVFTLPATKKEFKDFATGKK
ncbi:hypothetical protein DBR32_04640 [Taibaiella sp. KBW10]|uniref:DUF4476 domain-containing protein n=1 Tax=Taibaiella sp. KBW10 TaxID=2153357 RepID=UPI000F59E903|nr:DUF4476 domain-containing protein [Taibaiella sp. KBW10]RQO31261.1 hypothetical protein DBR32_04640 [Taibaiella sp. KBW10]